MLDFVFPPNMDGPRYARMRHFEGDELTGRSERMDAELRKQLAREATEGELAKEDADEESVKEGAEEKKKEL